MTQAASSLTPAQRLNGNTWAQFLDHLHRGGAYGYWWTLDEIKTYQIKRGPRAGQHEKCKRTSWWPVGKPLALPNGETEHVYFGVHPAVGIPQERIGRDGPYTPKPEYTRPLITEIAAVNCLFAEFDAKDFADEKLGALEHIDRLPLKPSALIDSGGGYHAYWLLVEPTIITDANRAPIKHLQNRWVQHVDSDDDSKDLARVLRVPGRRNVKAKYGPDFPLIRFVYADFDQLYTLDQLAATIPPQITAVEARDLVPFTPMPGDQVPMFRKHMMAKLPPCSPPPGHKHHILRNAAIKLASLIWTGCLSNQQIADGLHAAAERNACDIGYAHRTIANAITYGSARARTIPNRQQPARPVSAADDTAIDARPTIDISTFDLPIIMPDRESAWPGEQSAAGVRNATDGRFSIPGQIAAGAPPLGDGFPVCLYTRQPSMSSILEQADGHPVGRACIKSSSISEPTPLDSVYVCTYNLDNQIRMV